MKRILFVDDQFDRYQPTLQPDPASCEITVAGLADAALRLMEACPFDAVVAGLRTPGMDAAQFLERVRERFPGMMRVVVAGDHEREAALRAIGVAHQFLPKPFDIAALRKALERGCGPIQDAATVRRIVSAVGVLPCLPRTAALLMRALEDSDVPVSTVARIVGEDIAITAKVMQLANSAFFGRPQKVTTIPCAVSLLGVDTLRQLVIAAEVFRAFLPRTNIEGFSTDHIQSHSHLTAAIAARLPLPKAFAPTATIAALLHDCGKLVMASRLPLECERIRRLTVDGRVPFHAAEEKVLGASHAEIGAYLLSLWALPAGVVSAVERHHRPSVEKDDDPPFGAPAAVYFANLLAHEREPEAAGADPPLIDLDYLAAVGKQDELAAWRQTAETAAAA